MKQIRRLATLAAAVAILLGFSVAPANAIDARPCGNEPVPQIRLVLGPGAVVCYGGSVGKMRIDNLRVQGLAAGGYYGYVKSYVYREAFKPGTFHRLDWIVTELEITPPF
ncbi:hypothetical protein [Amycolatopsis anabasis]|uniref:hypothetical protein n=1 Tax=Amycolatopsis anabasis TaxID=1840409 RepID=UPI00131EAB5D|nr:hypothetical protein [Amycolatopsis anabasis]